MNTIIGQAIFGQRPTGPLTSTTAHVPELLQVTMPFIGAALVHHPLISEPKNYHSENLHPWGAILHQYPYSGRQQKDLTMIS